MRMTGGEALKFPRNSLSGVAGFVSRGFSWHWRFRSVRRTVRRTLCRIMPRTVCRTGAAGGRIQKEGAGNTIGLHGRLRRRRRSTCVCVCRFDPKCAYWRWQVCERDERCTRSGFASTTIPSVCTATTTSTSAVALLLIGRSSRAAQSIHTAHHNNTRHLWQRHERDKHKYKQFPK